MTGICDNNTRPRIEWMESRGCFASAHRGIGCRTGHAHALGPAQGIAAAG